AHLGLDGPAIPLHLTAVARMSHRPAVGEALELLEDVAASSHHLLSFCRWSRHLLCLLACTIVPGPRCHGRRGIVSCLALGPPLLVEVLLAVPLYLGSADNMKALADRDTPVDILVRLRKNRCFYADPAPASAAKTG